MGKAVRTTEIRVRGALRVRPGQLSEFKTLAAEMMAVTRERDRRTLGFETFLDEESGVWIALEHYPDSEALLEHWSLQDRDLKGRFLETCDPEPAELYGAPSPELLAAMGRYTPRVYAPLDRIR